MEKNAASEQTAALALKQGLTDIANHPRSLPGEEWEIKRRTRNERAIFEAKRRVGERIIRVMANLTAGEFEIYKERPDSPVRRDQMPVYSMKPPYKRAETVLASKLIITMLGKTRFAGLLKALYDQTGRLNYTALFLGGEKNELLTTEIDDEDFELLYASPSAITKPCPVENSRLRRDVVFALAREMQDSKPTANFTARLMHAPPPRRSVTTVQRTDLGKFRGRLETPEDVLEIVRMEIAAFERKIS